MEDITGAVSELLRSLEQAKQAKILSIDQLPPRNLASFQSARHSAVCANVSSSRKRVVKLLDAVISDPSVEHEVAQKFKRVKISLEATEIVGELDSLATDFLEVAQKSEENGSGKTELSLPAGIPAEIRSELSADTQELKACLRAKCFRSAVILSGRILETALHRKYYEATGNDLLEKSPGIGLGNLIARLSEKNIGLDPALGNQIHLINNVRIFSVHTKKEAFTPSEAQAKAIALYTFDVLEKLFAKR